ncbi:MAG: hypothetical protein KC486_14770 [Myxococcales bacterium]|nr:hypothetical protein [Myxococcales bacterium]MCA9659604.1 hypothetical protein [Myxococcales bacterium]MCB9568576.1 hypothetical protein [Myxococcales bacterium]MCB9701956.1 hypothetical protein [Myxococcales bacterium]
MFPKAEAQIRRLVEELSHHRGYRTLWLDRRGYLCHSEPDDDYESVGFTYVTTVFRPGADELGGILGSFFAAREREREIAHGLVPLLATA